MAQPTSQSGNRAGGGDGWIEIFRAGDYRDQGKAEITRADLARVVANYDPSFHEAPVCIGHPEHNLPAYAWVDSLKLDGDMLLAKEKQVDPDFAEMRSSGKFKKRSAAFYRDAEGKISGLRHVGWLGAQPPAVKGLKNVNFGDNTGRDFIEVEFGEESAMAEEQKFTFAEWWKQLWGGAAPAPGTPAALPASTAFSDEQVKKAISDAVGAVKTEMQGKVAALETKLAEQATAFTERENKIVAGERSQRVNAAIAGLKQKSAWIPAFEQMRVPDIFSELEKATTTIEFGEGAAKTQKSPLDAMVAFMEGLPKIVPGGKFYQGAPASAGAQGNGKTGDPLADAALARAAEKNITFSEALDQVAAENPQLTMPGGSAAGAV